MIDFFNQQMHLSGLHRLKAIPYWLVTSTETRILPSSSAEASTKQLRPSGNQNFFFRRWHSTASTSRASPSSCVVLTIISQSLEEVAWMGSLASQELSALLFRTLCRRSSLVDSPTISTKSW